MTYRPRKNGDHTEQIHLPAPTLIPMFAALGLTIMLLGLILSWWIVAAGGAILLVTLWRWIAAARQEYAQLPRER
jgi:hypothetical protein